MSLFSKHSLLVGLFLAVVFSTGFRVRGAEMQIIQTLKAPDAASGDLFGLSVALDLPYLLVGAPNNGNGSTYVFRRDPNGGLLPWDFVSELTPSALTTGAQFGFSTALHGFLEFANPRGPRIAVGAPFSWNTFNGDGAVYLFNSSWGEEPKLTAPLPTPEDLFGFAVSMSSQHLAVGAPQDDDSGMNGGAVYLYRSEHHPIPAPFTWELLTKKIAPGGESGANFGAAVATDDEILVVGAPLGETAQGTDAGVVVIYDRFFGGMDNWGQVKRIGASDGHRNARFGQAVAVSEDVVAVGASEHILGPDLRPGAVYLYGRNVGGNDQWGLIRKILASDAEHNAKFGTSLSMSDGVLAVGAPLHSSDSGSPLKGAVYLYGRNEGGFGQWGEIGRINLPGGPQTGIFGSRIGLDGTVPAGASPLADTSDGARTGAVTMITVPQVEPLPGNLIVNGGFNAEPVTGGLPTVAGDWKTGNSVAILNALFIPGISPIRGTQVLNFVATTPGGTAGSGTGSNIYQLIDLAPYADRVASGNVMAALTYYANRRSIDAQSDDQFEAHILAFDGDLADFPTAFFTNFLGLGSGVLHSDADTGSWEPVSAQLRIPAGATYLALSLAVKENVFNDLTGTEFDGHFADSASLYLTAEPEQPEIVEVRVLNNCDVSLQYFTQPGFHYSLQKSTNLIDWTTIRWGMTGTGSEQAIIFAGGLIPKTYYRILVGW